MTRREQALEHHKQVLENDFGHINYSVDSSCIYNNTDIVKPCICIKETDCLSGAINMSNQYDESMITILNFASFTQPGGGYIQGAMAQEESLCSESNLYEILSDERFDEYYKYNQKHKNNGLYHDRAIFTPDVRFTRSDVDYYFNVLTCAAPNYNSAKAHGYSDEEIIETYENRMRFIYNVLHKEQQGVLITGLWGCGVFGYPRELGIKAWEENANIDTLICIPKNHKTFNKRSNE